MPLHLAVITLHHVLTPVKTLHLGVNYLWENKRDRLGTLNHLMVEQDGSHTSKGGDSN